VRWKGFEPSRYCYRQPLKLVRLPVPPPPHDLFSTAYEVPKIREKSWCQAGASKRARRRGFRIRRAALVSLRHVFNLRAPSAPPSRSVLLP
jgi:hypothetical protein